MKPKTENIAPESVGAEKPADGSGSVKTRGPLKVVKGRKLADSMFRSMYNKTPVMMHATDREGRLITVNDYWLVNLGYSRREVLDHSFLDFLTPQSRRFAEEEVWPDFLANGYTHDVELQMAKKNGGPVDVSLSAVLDKDANGQYSAMAYMMDITLRKKSEEMLSLGEERLEALLEMAEMEDLSEEEIIHRVLEDAVRLTRSKIGYFNFVHEDQSHLELFAVSREVMQQCGVRKNEKYPIHSSGIWSECILTRKPQIHNDYNAFSPKKGYPSGHIPILRHMSVPIFDRDKVIAIVGVGNKEDPYDESDARQLTLFSQGIWRHIQRKRADLEKKGLEARLRQGQRMEAMGALAGGIAHDFNNILAPIIGYAEMEMEEAKRGNRPHEGLESIIKAGHRAKELVRQILTFSRGGEHDVGPVRIQTIIKESIKLIRSSLPSTITITQRIDDKCGPVMTDPTQMHQVVMNLCTNAFHAMQESGGILHVGLNETRLSAPDLKMFPSLKEGVYVKLAIIDTGKGMDKEIIPRIFEPYFSTKNKEEGTGLGLSMVHGIVSNLNGAIKVYSEPGKGSSFHVLLPVVHSQPVRDETAALERIPGGDERILVVDDEEMMVSMTLNMLERLGYRARGLSSSRDALALFEKDPQGVDLVITDLTMPEMTGVQLAEKLRAIRPGLPIVLCTGFGERTSRENARKAGISTIMNKPIVIRDVALAVRTALDRG